MPLGIARDMAKTLRSAHEAGVVHRDRKPENLLLSDSGGVKIVDFRHRQDGGRCGDSVDTPRGAARSARLHGSGALLGAAVDARADIYAFGIVVIETLTGHHRGAARAAVYVSPGKLMDVLTGRRNSIPAPVASRPRC